MMAGRFNNLGTIDISGQIILLCTMSSSVSGQKVQDKVSLEEEVSLGG